MAGLGPTWSSCVISMISSASCDMNSQVPVDVAPLCKGPPPRATNEMDEADMKPAGEEQEFLEVLNRYQLVLRRVSRMYADSPEQGEDLLQETMYPRSVHVPSSTEALMPLERLVRQPSWTFGYRERPGSCRWRRRRTSVGKPERVLEGLGTGEGEQ